MALLTLAAPLPFVGYWAGRDLLSGDIAPGLSFAALTQWLIAGAGGLALLVSFLVLLLGGLLFLSAGLAALRADNWVLRATPAGLYLKLRRFTDYRLPSSDEIVAYLPRSAIRWIRAHDQHARHVWHHAGRAHGGSTSIFWRSRWIRLS